MAKFLTPEWFDEVERLRDEAGDLELTPAHKEAVVNVTVESEEGEVRFCFSGGELCREPSEDAKTTVKTNKDVAMKLFFQRDVGAALEAFMSGQISIDGDLGQLMAVQASPPSAAQKKLVDQIQAMSEM